jgi:hypothetical protein
MTDLERALAEIHSIRSHVARGVEFRGYGPSTLAATGLLAGLAAFVQSVRIDRPTMDPNAFLGLWSMVAILSVVIIAAETVARSKRVHSGLAQEMVQSAAEQFLPAGIAGVLLTAVLTRFSPESVWMLPGLWQIVFSLGVFGSCRFLPRPMLAVGVWYLVCGMVCLALGRGANALSPWTMGVPFGLGQLMVAGVLQFGRGGRS